MKRLPTKFETEVLSKHTIKWSRSHHGVDGYFVNDTRSVNKYEIAGIALASMGSVIMLNGDGYWLIKPSEQYGEILVKDRDFCNCVFKAVDVIWRRNG